MRTKTFRYGNLVILAAYLDGFIDCLRGEGKIPEDATYALGYIDLGADIRVLAICVQTKTDFDECPITVIAKECLQEGELEQLNEIRLSTVGNTN